MRRITRSGRGGGHCCRKLHIPVSPEQLQASYLAAKAEKKYGYYLDPDGNRKRVPLYGDVQLLRPMLTSLDESFEGPSGETRHYYACKHLVGNECSIYEIRPWMCRVHPTGGVCEYEGCEVDWKAQIHDPPPALRVVA